MNGAVLPSNTDMTKRPRVAITCGDVAGIGPEIVVKALANWRRDRQATDTVPLVVGPVHVIRDAASRWAPGLHVSESPSPDSHPDVIQVADVGLLKSAIEHGKVQAEAGRIAYEALRHAIKLAMTGEVQAICTAPIHKEALARAGVPYPGHTEILADFSGSANTAMMLVTPHLRVMLVTLHCALAEAIRALTIQEQHRVIRLAWSTMRQMGIENPRIAVAGLNPHAGEGGLFGREDAEIIAPAVAAARAQGIDATGPWPGDTVFMQARTGRFDIVVAQYHDQGLIPIKLLGISDGVNLTAGLPFVRTSPDHGTAFDIAWQGVADPCSMRCALDLACDMALQHHP